MSSTVWVAYVETIRVSAWAISVASWSSQTRILSAKLKFQLNSKFNPNSIVSRISENFFWKKFEPLLFKYALKCTIKDNILYMLIVKSRRRIETISEFFKLNIARSSRCIVLTLIYCRFSQFVRKEKQYCQNNRRLIILRKINSKNLMI